MNVWRIVLGLGLGMIGTMALADVRGLPDFTELVEKQGAAVVNISTTQVVKGTRQFPQIPNLDEDDPMFEFFRRFIPKQPPGHPREFQHKSLGSGFVISSDGYVLTNAHVVESAEEVVVKLNDKREFKAKVIGFDKRSDVALIKIDAAGLPTVKLGDANQLKVGEWVVAIGSPFGFENSVTAGIVSAKGRSLPQENYVPFIQTDVAVNPGNSGGPLFNMRGEVVGINSQIYSRTGGFMGLSFAIPIDLAMDVQSQLRANGRVSRGRIGVVIQEVTRELAESFGLGKARGALVSSVERGGPAEKAGVEAGDIILRFDSKPIDSSIDLPRIVGATKPGTRVSLQVWRKRAQRDLTVSVGEIADERVAASGPSKTAPELAANRLGLVLSELSAEEKKELKLSSGIKVDDVAGGSVRTELRAGDVILAVIVKGTNSELKTVDQFNQLIGQAEKGSNITMLVRRGENQLFVSVKNIG